MARRQTQNTHDPEKKFHDDVVDPFEDAVKQEQAASTQLVGNVTDPRLGEAQWNNDDDGQEYDEAAITKIQAVQRGRQARARAHSLRFSGCEKIPRQLTPPARQKFRSPSSSLDGSPSRRIGRPVAVVADPDVMRDKMARTDVNRPSQLARTKSKLVPVSETEEAKLGELDEAEVRFGEGILEPGGNSPEGMEGDKAGGDEAAQEHTSCLGPNEEVMRESAAAARIEAAARGGAAGEEEAALHEEPKPASDAQQNDAATKIQAVQRGRLARRQAARIRAEKMQQEKAAISMQAAEREVQARKAIMLEQQNKAATKIQAAERRRVARRQVAEMRKERADWEVMPLVAHLIHLCRVGARVNGARGSSFLPLRDGSAREQDGQTVAVKGGRLLLTGY